MRPFSLQRRHRSLPNMFAQSWRRWMARRADQLLETARLGSDNLEYLTHDPKATDCGLCPVTGGHADDLLRRLMLALDLDPYELALSDPACFVTCAGVARCVRAGKIVRRIWRARRPVTLGQVATIGATIVKTPWRLRCCSPCEAVQRPRRRANVHISPDERGVCDMKAADVMVCAVISVRPSARVEEVAGTLLANRISAVPVIDEQGELLGIVSEGDLMRRAEAGTDRSRSWWLEYLTGKQVLAAEYVKSHSHKVTDVMTRSVITATPETPLSEIATLLERNRIKRVPIVQNGKVVGIVSRANLLQALASMPTKNTATASASDSQIRDKVLSRLNAELWRPSMLNVTVRDGTVDLWGFVASEDEKKATRIAVESIPGVKTINDHLTIPPAEIAMV